MNEPVGIPAVILAGGQSRRMGGGDKCLQELGGRRMLDHVIVRIAPQAAPLALNANGPAARFAAFGLPVLADPLPGQPGPLAGVLAAMHWAAGLGAPQVVTVAGDTPFFPTDLVARLAAGAGPGGLALAATEDAIRGTLRQPTFGIWPVDLRDDLRAALAGGLRKVVAWTGSHGAADVVFATPGGVDPFFNVNTPEDLADARARVGEPGA
ncbi:molybdenum cofactor guanylyltransferase MobA [Tropicimonas sp. IMCC34043]|uniref:molybdenum cofactor guanylyltransferase MobA n=1 Tax=Tropicimonas sp. IMCC34043 TaxID=2248760 RepID=UPI000E21E297|nr:molybdenum cofactor guanylyltransferase MobA [Tropicimonas sp. IMCC34043]